MDITWNEATESIKSLKLLQPVKEAFFTTMGLSDWSEAEKTYKHHTDVTRLQQFVGRDFKDIPKDFKVLRLSCKAINQTCDKMRINVQYKIDGF